MRAPLRGLAARRQTKRAKKRARRRVQRRRDRKELRNLDVGAYADGIRIPEVQGRSGAILRPGGITYDVADELDAYGSELHQRQRAEGIRASRTADTRVAGYGPQADAARDLTARALPEYEAATLAYRQAQDDLGSFVRRRPKDGQRYKLTRWGLLGADTGAVLGALIYVGEVPVLAAGTAFAVGLSAVTAGVLGGDVRELRLARDRHALLEAEQIEPEVAQRYPRLFGPPNKHRDTYGLAMVWGLLVILAVTVGVFALRAAIEGLVGVVFAGFALATTLASFISSWAHGDDVADLLEVYADRVQSAKAEYRRHLIAPEPSAQAAWTADAESIRAEHEALGEAKAESVRGLKHAVYRNNRQVFGDGTTKHRVLRPVRTSTDVDEEFDRFLGRDSVNHFEENGEPPF